MSEGRAGRPYNLGLMLRLVGGANVPAMKTLRVSATWPLAVLTVDGQRTTLRLRLAGRWFRPTDLDATPGEVKLITPAKPPFRLGLKGIDITLNDSTDFYFWTGRADEALRYLTSAGFPVGSEVRRATKAWKATP